MTDTLMNLLLSADPVGQLQSLHARGKLRDLEPTLADLAMDIPAGYHHKDNLVHSFQVLQNAIERETDGPDLTLRAAALFHDIGKPATRAFGTRGLVTFVNHDLVGSRIVVKVLRKHGFSKAMVKDVSILVDMHMRSHTFKEGWGESAVRRLTVDAGGEVQLQRLIIIFYADTTTAMPEKKARIHRSVDALAAEVARVAAKDKRAALRPALNGLEVAELLGLTPGRELGVVMKFLNSDDIIKLSREDATAKVLEKFSR
jgi:poly(A) polymerase